MAVLIITQLLNVMLVPWFAHAGLALAIGIGAMLNALWLLLGLLRRGSFKPLPGWRRFVLQVLLASTALGLYLYACASGWDWLALRSQPVWRIALMAAVIAGSALIYLGLLRMLGLRPQTLLGR